MTFWNKGDFDNFLVENEINVEDILLITSDSYDEEKISKKIRDININICFAISLQLSIIGYGNKTFGYVTYKNEKIDIIKFFDENKILYKSKFNDKLNPDDLTPRRLIRFFRYKINNYIKNKNVTSYLYKKYCYEKNDVLKLHIHPGVEHLLLPTDDNSDYIIKNLIKTYKNLDESNKTNVCDRLIRVLISRGFKI